MATEATVQEIVFKYTAKIDDLERQYAELEKKMLGAEKQSDKLNTTIEKDGVHAAASFKDQIHEVGKELAIAFEAKKITDFLVESAKLAFQTRGLRDEFKRTFDASVITTLRTAVKGTVSDLELMKIAMKANNFKVPMDVLAKGLEFVRKRADQTGESIEDLTNKLVNGLGKKSIRELKGLQLSEEDLNKAIQKTGNFYEGVAEVLENTLGPAGNEIETLADKQEKLNAKIEDLKVKIGDGLAPAVEKLLGFINAEIKGLQVIDNAIENIFDKSVSRTIQFTKEAKALFEDFKKSVDDPSLTPEQIKRNSDEAIAQLEAQKKQILENVEASKKLVDVNQNLFGGGGDAVNNAILQNKESAAAAEDQIKSLDLLISTIKSYSGTLTNLGKNQENYNTMTIDQLQALADAGDEFAAKALAIRKRLQAEYDKAFKEAMALIDKYLRDEGQRYLHQLDEEEKKVKANIVLTDLQKKQILDVIALKKRNAGAITEEVKSYKTVNPLLKEFAEAYAAVLDKDPKNILDSQLAIERLAKSLLDIQEVIDRANADPQLAASSSGTTEADALAALRDQDTQDFIDAEQKKQDAVQETANAILQITDKINQYYSASADYQISLLEDRNERGLLSDRQLAEQKKKILLEEAKREKRMSLFQAAIYGPASILRAGAESPAAAIAAAVVFFTELALIIAEPLPKFKKGVLDYDGKGTETSDSNVVMISNHESVVPAARTKKHKEILREIMYGDLDKYLMEFYVPNLLQSRNPKTESFNDRNIVMAIYEDIRANKENTKLIADSFKTNWNPRRN